MDLANLAETSAVIVAVIFEIVQCGKCAINDGAKPPSRSCNRFNLCKCCAGS